MRLAIYGAGPQGLNTLEVAQALADWGLHFRECPVLYDDNPEKGCPLPEPADDLQVVVAIGHNPKRTAIVERLKVSGYQLARPLVHLTAVVSHSAKVGHGSVVGPGVIIESGVVIGENCIINSGAFVGHDAYIEDGVNVCQRALIGGRTLIGAESMIGFGAEILPRKTVGPGAVIGAGALVTKDTAPCVLAYGSPARAVEPIGPDFDWGRVL